MLPTAVAGPSRLGALAVSRPPPLCACRVHAPLRAYSAGGLKGWKTSMSALASGASSLSARPPISATPTGIDKPRTPEMATINASGPAKLKGPRSGLTRGKIWRNTMTRLATTTLASKPDLAAISESQRSQNPDLDRRALYDLVGSHGSLEGSSLDFPADDCEPSALEVLGLGRSELRFWRDTRNQLANGYGVMPVLQKVQRGLDKFRTKLGWEDEYKRQFPEANLGDNVKAAALGRAFTANIAAGQASHPYVLLCSQIMMAFLRHPSGHAPARSLLRRQMAEGVPLTEEAALAALDYHDAVPLNEIGPLLPTPTTPAILAGTIRSAKRQGSEIKPAEVRMVITCTLEAIGYSIDPKDWDWNLWAALIGSYKGDFRGALLKLGEFKNIVLAERDKAIEDGHSWPGARADAVVDAYTNVMHLWRKERSQLPASSDPVPRHLAADLRAVIAPTPQSALPEDTRELPHRFMTAWFNAERVAHSGLARILWADLAGISHAETLGGTKPLRPLSPLDWKAFLDEVERDPPRSYRPLATLVPTVMHTRLAAAVANHPNPDLPLMYLLLGSLTMGTAAERFDHAAKALVRACRIFSSTRHDGIRLLPSAYPRFPPNMIRQPEALHVVEAEWDWVAKCVGPDIALPFSRPKARLRATKPGESSVIEMSASPGDLRRKVEANLPALRKTIHDAIVHQARAAGETGTTAEIFKRAMSPSPPEEEHETWDTALGPEEGEREEHMGSYARGWAMAG